MGKQKVSQAHVPILERLKKYGPRKLLIVHYLYTLIKEGNGTIKFHEGKKWVYQPRRMLLSRFSHLTMRQARSITEHLVIDRVVEAKKLSEDPRDHSFWYSFPEDLPF